MKNYWSTANTTKNILLAPNAFKGSLEAVEFCRIIAEELSHPDITLFSLPMCDGGDGTAGILATYVKASPEVYLSTDALGRPHPVTYYSTADCAIVDLASVCGLKDLSREEYDVFQANTAGLGKVLLHIARQGKRRIILGIGGSASIDGGLGALVEMGLQIVKSKDNFRNHLIEIVDFNSVKLKENFKNIEWFILADVRNQLCGLQGAAAVFGPQKGASPLQVSALDLALQRFATLLLSKTGIDVLPLKHGGAAGGIAASFHALLGVQLSSGADFCLRISDFRNLLPRAKLVITGEGKLDAQSLQGKLPGVISSLCRQNCIPVYGVAGQLEPPLPDFDRLYSLLDYATNLPDALRQPGYYLRLLAKDLKRNILNL